MDNIKFRHFYMCNTLKYTHTLPYDFCLDSFHFNKLFYTVHLYIRFKLLEFIYINFEKIFLTQNVLLVRTFQRFSEMLFSYVVPVLSC